jgi:ketosteroid isomerase-like protein
MKRWIALLALVCLVPTTAMAGEPRAHIDDALTTFVAAFNAGDGATVASLYTEDAALYPPGGTFWQGAIDSGMKIDDLHAIEVDAKGDLAGEVGVFTLSVPGEGGVTKVPGRYIVIWKRSGHTWQLHRDIWNTN